MTKTKLHSARLLDQIQTNLINLQRDIRNNAQTHKQMALAQSPDLGTLQSFVSDCASQYLRRIKWLDDLWADRTRREWVLSHAAEIGWNESDITHVVEELRQAAHEFALATRDWKIVIEEHVSYIDDPTQPFFSRLLIGVRKIAKTEKRVVSANFSYRDVAKRCDQLLALVEAPESLWPE